jgi:hypothetical protein
VRILTVDAERLDHVRGTSDTTSVATVEALYLSHSNGLVQIGIA